MLELRGIKKTYYLGRAAQADVLKGISLSFPDQGMVFVVGKSGSGKSTLLNILGGLDSPTGGELLINGRSVSEFRSQDFDCYRNSQVGFVFQEYNLVDHLTVRENIALVLDLQGKMDSQQVEKMLERVELQGFGNRKISTLSGGQKQRVAIARAMIKEPQIILADEPTGALDSETGKSILKLLKEISAERLVVVITHDMEFAEQYGDRIIEMKDGEVFSDRELNRIESIKATEKAWTKPKLSFRRTLSFGLKGLKLNRVRLALSIVLSILAFGCLGAGLALRNFNYDAALVRALQDDGGSAILYRSQSNNVNLSQDYMAQLEKEYPDIEFRPVYNLTGELYSIKDHFHSYENSTTYYQKISYDYMMDWDEEFAKEQGMQLVAGKIPDRDDQVLATQYMFEVFQKRGFEALDDSWVEIKDYDDLIGKKLYDHLRQEKLEIVGIVDTHVDPRFDVLKPYNANDLHGVNNNLFDLYREYNYYQEISLHQIYFMAPGYYDRNFAKGLPAVPVELLGIPRLEAPTIGTSFTYVSQLSRYTKEELVVTSYADQIEGIIIPKREFKQIVERHPLGWKISSIHNEIVMEYVDENIEPLMQNEEFVKEYNPNGERDIEEIKKYYQRDLEGTRYEEYNPYGKSGNELLDEVYAAFLDQIYENGTLFALEVYGSITGGSAYNILGYFKDESITSALATNHQKLWSYFAPYQKDVLRGIFFDLTGSKFSGKICFGISL